MKSLGEIVSEVFTRDITDGGHKLRRFVIHKLGELDVDRAERTSETKFTHVVDARKFRPKRVTYITLKRSYSPTTRVLDAIRRIGKKS
jgi:hypothetical protein